MAVAVLDWADADGVVVRVDVEDALVNRVRLDDTVLDGVDFVGVPVRVMLADGCVGDGVRLMDDDRVSVRVLEADTSVAELVGVPVADTFDAELVALTGVEVDDADVLRVLVTDTVDVAVAGADAEWDREGLTALGVSLAVSDGDIPNVAVAVSLGVAVGEADNDSLPEADAVSEAVTLPDAVTELHSEV